MDTDESGSDDRAVRLPRDGWEKVPIQVLVWSAVTALKMTSEGARATLARLGSHGAVLLLAMAVIAVGGLNMPAFAREQRQPADVLAQADSWQAVFTLPANAARAASNVRPLRAAQNDTLTRQAAPLTQIPDRLREAIITYTVRPGDTLFGIALLYNLAPETVLWANADLKDNPDLMNVGMVLNIPPVDGVVHVVEDGDTLESIAAKYKVSVDAIVAAEWNSLRQGQQPIAGQHLIVPGGKREFVVWQLPKPTAPAATGYSYNNAGFCDGVLPAALGTGTFVWPNDDHRVTGNPYASWHRGVDLAGHTGDPIYASDAGTVMYAGWNTWGYGNLIVLDHGNGWQTWYAHLSDIYVVCGQQIYQGATIGAIGSTGHSTGPHLHFETRYNGDLPNPLNVLP